MHYKTLHNGGKKHLNYMLFPFKKQIRFHIFFFGCSVDKISELFYYVKFLMQ